MIHLHAADEAGTAIGVDAGGGAGAFNAHNAGDAGFGLGRVGEIVKAEDFAEGFGPSSPSASEMWLRLRLETRRQ